MKKALSLLLILALVLSFSAFASAETPINSAYVYYEDELPKYWLDFTGSAADNLVLHCFFLTDHWEETFYILDFVSASANSHQGTYRIETVYDEKGNDVSNWFRTLSVAINPDNTAQLYIERDENTRAGGPDSTIQSGLYKMTPADAGVVYECYDSGVLAEWVFLNADGAELHFADGEIWYLERGETKDYTVEIERITAQDGYEVPFQSFTITFVQGSMILNVQGAGRLNGASLLTPRVFLQEEMYTPAQIARLAQMYYLRHYGFYPPEADVDVNQDGTYSIHLYEIVDHGDGTHHTATSAWYTVDASGYGTNDLLGGTVDLVE